MKLRPGNAQHQGARDSQEDSFAFSDLDNQGFASHAGFLGLVADGMGGMAHGGAAGALAVRELLAAYATKEPDEDVPHALLRAVQQAHAAVSDLAHQSGQSGQVGTTAAAIVVHDAGLHWIAVGDTRIYLYRDGRLTQVTVDHVYSAELDAKVLAGQLSEASAREDPDRDALTSHLGATRLKHIDRSIRPFPLFEGDRVLVCTDGLYRALSEERMAEPLAGDPQRACEALVHAAVSQQLDRQDNITVLVIAADPTDSKTAVETSR